MFRNQYDTDVTVWSPEGRLLQVRVTLSFCFCSVCCLFALVKYISLFSYRVYSLFFVCLSVP